MRNISRRYRQRVPQKPNLQAEHPAFIRAAATEKAIGIDPKYMHSYARRRAPMSSAEWAIASLEFQRGHAG